jgi:large subunit ribosomal protein L18
MSFSMKYRRRREGKTNYHKRLRLLKSGKARLVVRRSNTAIRAQLVLYEPSGDKVLAQASSADLQRAGWNAGMKSVPAAYLVGYLAGVRAKKAGVQDAIADLGLYTMTKGSRLFAAVKGAIDAGLTIPVGDDVLPSEDRIKGEHIQAHRNVAFDVDAYKEKLTK